MMYDYKLHLVIGTPRACPWDQSVDIVYNSGVKFFLCFIPFAGIFFALKCSYDLAKVFGQSTGFGIGMILLSFPFSLILAFSNNIRYCGSGSNMTYQLTSDVVDSDRLAQKQAAIDELKRRRQARENSKH